MESPPKSPIRGEGRQATPLIGHVEIPLRAQRRDPHWGCGQRRLPEEVPVGIQGVERPSFRRDVHCTICRDRRPAGEPRRVFEHPSDFGVGGPCRFAPQGSVEIAPLSSPEVPTWNRQFHSWPFGLLRRLRLPPDQPSGNHQNQQTGYGGVDGMPLDPVGGRQQHPLSHPQAYATRGHRNDRETARSFRAQPPSQPLTQQVEAENDNEDHGPDSGHRQWEPLNPQPNDAHVGCGQHLPQFRHPTHPARHKVLNLYPDVSADVVAQEAQPGGGHQGAADFQREQHPHHGHNLWQDMAEEDPEVRLAEGSRRFDVLSALDQPCLLADNLGGLRPAGHREPDDKSQQANLNAHCSDRAQRDHQNGHRQRTGDGRIQYTLHPAGGPAGGQADQGPQRQPHGSDDGDHDQRWAHRPQQPAQEIPTAGIRTEREAGDSECGERCKLPLIVNLDDLVFLQRIMWCQGWPCDGDHDHKEDDQAA